MRPPWTSAAALLAACLGSACGSDSKASPDYTMTMKTTFELDTGGPKQMEMTTYGTKGRSRMDIGGTFLPANSGGSYTIVDGAAGTMTSVIPNAKMATIIHVSDAMNGASLYLVKSVAKGEPTLQVDDLGAGEPIQGFPTRRYHFTSEQTTIYSNSAGSCERTANTEGTAWKTTAVDVPPTPLEQLPSITSAAIAAQGRLYAMMKDRMPGFTVKQVSTVLTSTHGGPPARQTSSSELAAFARGKVEGSRFVVPAGFRTIDPREITARESAAMTPTIKVARDAAAKRSLAQRCGGADNIR